MHVASVKRASVCYTDEPRVDILCLPGKFDRPDKDADNLLE
jgi:hypothetical protein